MQITKEFLQRIDACSESFPRWEQFNQEGNLDSIHILKTLIKEKKLSWANWLIVPVMNENKDNGYRMYVSYAIYAAEQVLNIYEKKYPDNKRPRQAIDAAKRCIENPSKENKASATAYATAYATASAAADAAYAASAAADAADAASAADAADAASSDALKIEILQYGISLLLKYT